MLGDYRYYKEGRSLIANMFNVTGHSNASHFTSLRILKYLMRTVDSAMQKDRFMRFGDMVAAISDVFNNEEDVLETILRLIAVDRQLVELDTRQTETLDGATLIRITSSGKYYFVHLVSAFIYLDLVWQDTPIENKGLVDSLIRRIDDANLTKRFERVEMFINFLATQEESELSALGLTYQRGAFWGPFMPRIRRNYEKVKSIVQGKLGL